MINIYDYLLPENTRPVWLAYPAGLVELIRSGRVTMTPWHTSKVEAVAWDLVQLKTRLGRDLVPFAYRQDREDLACFEKGKGPAVIIIHDNTEPGWEDEGSYPSFADWLREAELEAASWEARS
jgi:hypothetical protein